MIEIIFRLNKFSDTVSIGTFIFTTASLLFFNSQGKHRWYSARTRALLSVARRIQDAAVGHVGEHWRVGQHQAPERVDWRVRGGGWISDCRGVSTGLQRRCCHDKLHRARGMFQHAIKR